MCTQTQTHKSGGGLELFTFLDRKKIRIIDVIEVLSDPYLRQLRDVIDVMWHLYQELRYLRNDVPEEAIEKILRDIYEVYYIVQFNISNTILLHDVEFPLFVREYGENNEGIEVLRVCKGSIDPERTLEILKDVLLEIIKKVDVKVDIVEEGQCVAVFMPLFAF